MRAVKTLPAHPLDWRAVVWAIPDAVVPAFADEAGADEVGDHAAPAFAGALSLANMSAVRGSLRRSVNMSPCA